MLETDVRKKGGGGVGKRERERGLIKRQFREREREGSQFAAMSETQYVLHALLRDSNVHVRTWLCLLCALFERETVEKSRVCVFREMFLSLVDNVQGVAVCKPPFTCYAPPPSSYIMMCVCAGGGRTRSTGIK